MLIIWRLYSLLCSPMGQFSSCSVSVAHCHFWSWPETSRYATDWLMRWPFSVGMGWRSSRAMTMGNCKKLIVCFGKRIYATFGGLSRVCLFLHTFPGPFTPCHGRFQVYNPIIVSLPGTKTHRPHQAQELQWPQILQYSAPQPFFALSENSSAHPVEKY